MGDGEIDERFWANAAAAQAQGEHMGGDGEDDISESVKKLPDLLCLFMTGLDCR